MFWSNEIKDDFDLVIYMLALIGFVLAALIGIVDYLRGESYVYYYPIEAFDDDTIVVRGRSFLWEQKHTCKVGDVLYSRARYGGRFSAKPVDVCETLRAD